MLMSVGSSSCAPRITAGGRGLSTTTTINITLAIPRGA